MVPQLVTIHHSASLSAIIQHTNEEQYKKYLYINPFILSTGAMSQVTTNQHLHGSGERNVTQRRTNVGPQCVHCSYFSWQKSTSQAKVTLNSKEIKPVTIPMVELCLAGGINQSVSWSVSQLVGRSVSRKFS